MSRETCGGVWKIQRWRVGGFRCSEPAPWSANTDDQRLLSTCHATGTFAVSALQMLLVQPSGSTTSGIGHVGGGRHRGVRTPPGRPASESGSHVPSASRLASGPAVSRGRHRAHFSRSRTGPGEGAEPDATHSPPARPPGRGLGCTLRNPHPAVPSGRPFLLPLSGFFGSRHREDGKAGPDSVIAS